MACTGDGGPEPGGNPSPSADGSPEGEGPVVPDVSVRGRDAVNLAVVGDFGTGGADALSVARVVRAAHDAEELDGFVTLGDNVYPSSQQEDELERAWETPYGWLMHERIDVVAALGDEDVEFGAEEVMRLLGMRDRWYSRRIGPVEIFVLDTVEYDSAAQIAWLERALVASDAPWKIAVAHVPAFACSKAGGAPNIGARWEPLFRRYGVSLVLSGNHHSYQRFAPERGVTHVVAGIGGAGLYSVAPGRCPPGAPELLVYDDDAHGFLWIAASEKELVGAAVTTDGSVLDRVDLPA
jgi:calcineurin-like phosphoesterase family protein